MNARYHACREGFLDSAHRWFMFAVIGLGAAAIINMLPDWLRSACAGGAALFGALDLTFDLSNRARVHALMKRRYFELLADVIEGKKDLRAVQVAINRFNADEEPAYHALLNSCWNAAQEQVYGDNAIAIAIPRHHLALKNFFRFGSRGYQTKSSP
jgi:hypothetical protein